MNFNDLLAASPKIKKIPLPATASQAKMAVPGRSITTPELSPKQAGVLVLFYPDEEGRTKLALILRKTYDGVHSGQIGLPGGQVEDRDESLRDTAVRETFEEIGVPRQDINIIKQLTKLYIPPSNFMVEAFMATLAYTPNFIRQETEVAEVLEVLLSELLANKNLLMTTVKSHSSAKLRVPAYLLNEHFVWGATAMILSEVKDILVQL